MARRTFFSFHYERDAWRAGQVRNSWVTQDREAAGFWDAAGWEEVKRKGSNGLLGVYIHKLKDTKGETDSKGTNPFDTWTFKDSSSNVISYPTYDWVNDDGYKNLGDWVEAAAKKAGR